MRKTRKPRRLLKKLSRSRGGDGRKRGVWQADRDLVSRRSSDRAEKQGHPPTGETRDTAFGAARPEDEFGLYFRRHLPGQRQERDVVWDGKTLRDMPSRLIKKNDGVRAGRDCKRDFLQMQGHSLAVAGG